LEWINYLTNNMAKKLNIIYFHNLILLLLLFLNCYVVLWSYLGPHPCQSKALSLSYIPRLVQFLKTVIISIWLLFDMVYSSHPSIITNILYSNRLLNSVDLKQFQQNLVCSWCPYFTLRNSLGLPQHWSH
jgi:hypothetical protein